MYQQSTTPTTTETTIERCEHCNGLGEVPSGYATLYGGCAWRTCPRCDGLGAVEVEPDAEGQVA